MELMADAFLISLEFCCDLPFDRQPLRGLFLKQPSPVCNHLLEMIGDFPQFSYEQANETKHEKTREPIPDQDPAPDPRMAGRLSQQPNQRRQTAKANPALLPSIQPLATIGRR
jgi:hypothetical protein